MRYEKESNVICLGDTKHAALYFDRILPISFLFEEILRHPAMEVYIGRRINGIDRKPIEQNMEEFRSELEKIINDYSDSNSISTLFSVFYNLLGRPVNPKLLESIIRLVAVNMNLIHLNMEQYYRKNCLNELPKSAVQRFNSLVKIQKTEVGTNEIYQTYALLIDLLSIFYAEDIQIENFGTSIRSNLDSISRKWAGKCSQVLIPSFCILNNEALDNDVSLSLLDINLIDTSKVKWEKIIEYRKDKESMKKLRNLRLFLHTNYQGKSRAFIEDDLGKRLDAYYDTCKDWGFETLTSTISVVMDSENLISLLVGSTCATLFGGPVAGLIAGASIEIGSISLNIAKRKYAFNKLKRDHDLAYIIEAKESLENTS